MSPTVSHSDRALLVSVIRAVLAAVIVYWLTTSLAATVAVGVVGLVTEFADDGVVPGWVAGLAAGLVVAGLGAAGLVQGGTPAVLFVAIVAVGGWLVLDGVRRWKTGDDGREHPSGVPEAPDGPEVMLWLATGNRVVRALDDEEPRTVTFLADDLALDESRVENVLELLDRKGMVEQKAGGYVAVERYRGRFGTVRSLLDAAPGAIRRVLARLSRPFRPSAWRA